MPACPRPAGLSGGHLSVSTTRGSWVETCLRLSPGVGGKERGKEVGKQAVIPYHVRVFDGPSAHVVTKPTTLLLVCPFVCLPACLPACLPGCAVCLPTCLPVLPVGRCVCLPAGLPGLARPRVCLPACLPACVSVFLPVCLSCLLSVCRLPVCLSDCRSA